MTSLMTAVLVVSLFLCLAYLYIVHNDRGLSSFPEEAHVFSSQRYSTLEIVQTAERLRANPITIQDALPPKTGRKYIVVGGAGFLGGWIVVHLLARGEDPKRIRVLDIRAPTRLDLTTGKALDVDFRVVDIANAHAVKAAFSALWPDTNVNNTPFNEAISRQDPGITVFHTAANIRFYERDSRLTSSSARVNVEGTRHIIDAARDIGVSVLIYTSSGSVSIRRSQFWLKPWQKEPKYFVQPIDDDDNLIPKKHNQFFSNYAYTKSIAESLVRRADRSTSGSSGLLRTGCLRPGNGIFGPGGDVLCGAYIVRKINPTWVPNILQNFVYVENCSLAHLCYEQRLIDILNGTTNPDIGGQAFCITDPCPPVTYGDVYHALNVLTKGKTIFPVLSPTVMLMISHLFEFWYLTRHYLLAAPSPFQFLGRAMPPLGGDLVNLQPSLFALVMVHLIFDDARARRSPINGGLGYRGLWTTLEGLCKLVDEHQKSGGHLEERQKNGGGINIGFGLVKAERSVEKVGEGMAFVNAAPEKLLN